MPYKIAIASGKGGTGKTTLSVNLFHNIAQQFSQEVHLVDCDVEEPNDLIFFPNTQLEKESTVFQLIPTIDQAKCIFCRKCVEYCEFNAIVVIPPVKFAEVNSSLCHSCGACIVACEDNAISENPEAIGTIQHRTLSTGGSVSEGRLKVGSTMQTMMIKELKKSVSEDTDIILYDSPPGTSCPVVETIADADFVILVTEPTPFGLYDLKLTVSLINNMGIPFGVIINKSNLGSNDVNLFLQAEGIELLGEVPFSREYAALYSKGRIFNNIPDEILNAYNLILQKLYNKIIQYEGDQYFKW